MVFLAFLYGLLIGSFLNVLIDRLPKGQNVLWGRSRCDYCKRNLRWFELIPVFSYVLQRGRCIRCKKSLSFQYPLIEVATAIGFSILFQFFGQWMWSYIPAVIIFCSLLVITIADSKYQIIPDSMVVVGLIGTVLWLYRRVPAEQVQPHILSSAGAAAFFYALWFLTKGRGMGFGDVKLAVLLGLLLGYPGVVIALYIAFLTGAAVGVILIFRGAKTLKSKIAFGPFMIFGTVGSLVFNTYILSLWKSFF